jgi:hypothetical protein
MKAMGKVPNKLYSRIIFLILFLLDFFCHSLSAQNAPAGPTPEALRRHVSTIENFMNRFNYEEDKSGNSVPIKSTVPAPDYYIRERNYQITALINFAVLNNPAKKILLDEFLQQVNATDNQVKLSLRDKQWFSEVQMEVLYNQKPEKLTLILQLEEAQPKTYHWAIRSVKGRFLNVKPEEVDHAKLIPPNSHGTDFIGLPQNLKPAKFISQFVSQEATVDQLSIFLYAVYRGDIIFKQTGKVVFHFLQLSNWIVRVEDLNKSFGNSGFMVSELIKADDAAKRLYALQELNIK